MNLTGARFRVIILTKGVMLMITGSQGGRFFRLSVWCGVLLVGVAGVSGHADGVTLYVSPQGKDTWSGKLPAPNASRTDGPFASLARARDVIREEVGRHPFVARKQGGRKEPVTVQVRGGTYYLSEPVTFTPEDSGTREGPVSYAAYPGETPVLCGGRRITGWRPYRGKIQCAFLPAVKAGKWYFRSLFVDGKRQTRARYPNVDPVDPLRQGFLYVGRGNERLVLQAIHNVGDWLEYEVTIPASGEYALWVRYANGMKGYSGLADMGGRTSVTVDGGSPVPLMHLPDTGSFQTFQWARSAALRLTAGRHRLRWRNDQGGGLALDVFVLCDDAGWAPGDGDWPPAAAGKHQVVLQAEDLRRAEAPQLYVSLAESDSAQNVSPDTFPYPPGTVKPSWAEAPEAEVHIFPGDRCCRNHKEISRLVKIDEATHTLRIAGPECRTPKQTGDRYFVENLLEELDSPGEWYLDRSAGYLYYWPKKEPVAKSEVIAPVLGSVFEFPGDLAKGEVLTEAIAAAWSLRETSSAGGRRRCRLCGSTMEARR
jgi:hypothetical protein